jgi:hypothetical protein
LLFECTQHVGNHLPVDKIIQMSVHRWTDFISDMQRIQFHCSDTLALSVVSAQVYGNREYPCGKTPAGIIPEQVFICSYEHFLRYVFCILARKACPAYKADYSVVILVHQQTETFSAAIQYLSYYQLIIHF